MTTAPYKEQGEEIARLCADAGLSPEEMGKRTAVSAETMRKIIRGYQPCSDVVMQSFRNIAELERLRQCAVDPERRVAAAELNETVNAVREIAEIDPKRFDAVKEMVAGVRHSIKRRPETRRVKGGGLVVESSSEAAETERALAAAAAEDEERRPASGYGQTLPTGAPSGKTSGPSSSASPHPSRRPVSPKKVRE